MCRDPRATFGLGESRALKTSSDYVITIVGSVSAVVTDSAGPWGPAEGRLVGAVVAPPHHLPVLGAAAYLRLVVADPDVAAALAAQHRLVGADVA